MPRILLLGLPRNGVTPLERYFIELGYKICHEPATQHVFSKHNAFIPSPYSRETTSSEILEQVNRENPEENFLLRDTAWAVWDADFIDNLPADMQVIFVVREPAS